MRISEFQGLWLRYTDSAKPVEVIDRVAYAFTNDARECLVERRDHLQWFLTSGRYVVAGVEVEGNGKPSEPPTRITPAVPAGTAVRRRGRG